MNEGLGLKYLSSNIAGTLGRQICAGLLQLGTLAVIARVYGPDGNGAFTVALLLPTMLASLLNFGIAPANVYFLGSRQVTPSIAWRKTLKLYTLISIAGMLVGTLVLLFYSEQWFPGIPTAMLWLALSAYPALFLLGLISSIFQGLQQFRQFNILLLIRPLLTLVFIIFLILAKIQDIIWLLVAYLIGMIFAILFALRSLNPFLSKKNDSRFPGYEKKALQYGFKAHIGNILAFVNYKADIFLVNFFIGPAGTGVYVIAVQLAERLWLLSQAVSTVLLPKLSELSGDENKRRVLTPLISRWVFLVTILGALLLATISYPLIVIVFGKAFLNAVMPLYALLPGIVLLASARIIANDIAARGHPEYNMYISLIVVFVNIIGNLMLIPRYGLVGAAISTSIGYFVTFLLIVYIYRNFTSTSILSNVFIKREDFRLINSLFSKINHKIKDNVNT